MVKYYIDSGKIRSFDNVEIDMTDLKYRWWNLFQIFYDEQPQDTKIKIEIMIKKKHFHILIIHRLQHDGLIIFHLEKIQMLKVCLKKFT